MMESMRGAILLLVGGGRDCFCRQCWWLARPGVVALVGRAVTTDKAIL